PATAALSAILPVLDDLVDGSSLRSLSDFILSLARPAPAAETIWKRVS
ncbi:MAG: VWA containing CoxE family protein, partial [Mesorhizobium sp.]